MKKINRFAGVDHIDLKIHIDVTYRTIYGGKLIASSELDGMDVSSLDRPIINYVKEDMLDSESGVYKQFIEFVNKVDELLDLRGFTYLGESEHEDSNSESTYRDVVINVSKDTELGHVSGKVLHTLRLSGNRETRSSHRNRLDKQKCTAKSPEALKLNNGKPLIVGEFESIRVGCTVKSQDETNIENKEFYTYLDTLKCVDSILDRGIDTTICNR